MADVQPQISLTIDPTDWISVSLDSLFNPSGLLASAIGLYNTTLLSIAGALLIWLSIRAVVATAQHGQMAGKHSEIWIPIRFVMAVGLILPLPPAGLSTGQQMLIGAAKIGSSAGNQIWAKVASDIGAMKSLTVPIAPDAKELAHGLWLMQSCIAITNQAAQYSGYWTASLVRHDNENETILTADTTAPDGGGELAQCGSVSFPHFADDLAQPLHREHVAAALAMAEAMQPAAQALALATSPAGPPSPPAVNINFQALIQDYSSKLMTVAGELVEMNNSKAAAREAFAAEAAKGGWVQAGAWALRITATNAELMSALHKLPSTTPPRMELYYSEAVAHHRAALGAADNYWVKQMGKVDASINTKAYGAGTEDTWLSVVDFSRIRFLYEHIAINVNDAGINPLSEIMSLGHSMISVSSMAVGTYIIFTESGDMAKGVLEAIPLVGHAVGAVAGTVTDALQKASPVFWAVAGTIFFSGAIMAYIVPFIPYIYWLLMVFRFLSRLVMGVLAVPLWAIAHLDIDGEGLGERTRQGYMLIIDNIIRPSVSVLALLLGFGLFLIVSRLFLTTYFIAIRSTISGHFGGVSAILAFTLLITAILVMLMHVSMRLVLDGADDVMEMAGTAVARQAGGQDHPSQANAALALSSVSNTTNAFGRGGGKGGKGDGDEEGAWKPSPGGKMSDNVGRDGGPEGGHEPPKPD